MSRHPFVAAPAGGMLGWIEPVVETGAKASPLPLERTAVDVQVIGPLAAIAVTQRFGNPSEAAVELRYLFPLPHEATVVDFELRIGSRTIGCALKELEEARRTFERALDEGRRAGLLEERRPNLFALALGNVQPGETIVVTIRLHQRLRYDDGEYRFAFPMGVTPRYHRDAGEAAETEVAIARPGERVGPVEIRMQVDAGVAAGDPASPSHPLDWTRLDERRFTVRPAGDVIPNQDFVVGWKVAGDEVRALAHPSSGDGEDTVLVTALPPRVEHVHEPPPREFVFVLDRSGSMSGAAIDQARNALKACLRSLGAGDTFALLAFNQQIEWYRKEAVLAADGAVRDADRWLDGIEAGGGTEILPALEAAVALEADLERPRMLVFLTDGAVSAEERVLSRVRARSGALRVFTFGIGPSVNRALLSRMAELGRGAAEFLQLEEDIEGALIRFQDRISYPVLRDLEIEWRNAEAWDVYPSALPDLYAGQPLELAARLRHMGGGPAGLVIRGRRGDETVQLEVPIVLAAAREPIVERAWAKARIEHLLDHLDRAPESAKARAELIGLSLQHRILTPLTALVAVDDEVVEKKGKRPEVLVVSGPLPEGLVHAGFGLDTSLASMYFGTQALRMGARVPERTLLMKLGPSAAADSVGGEVLYSLRGFEAQQPLTGAAESGEAALRALARAQNACGSWGSGASEVEATAASVLAFVRRGYTTRRGHYRRQLGKATAWLLAAKADGVAALARAEALRAMAEATGDAELAGKAERAKAELRADVAASFRRAESRGAGQLVRTLDELRWAGLSGASGLAIDEALREGPGELVRAWAACVE